MLRFGRWKEFWDKFPNHVDDDLKELIENTLHRDPKKRWSLK